MNYVLTIIIAVVFSLQALAQPDVAEKKEINGKTFYIHIVEEGQTLWSIHNLYNVEVDEIVKSNPGSDESIKVGQELKIPAAEEIETESTETTDVSIKMHKVKRGETLFGISRQYDTSVDEILKLNPDAEDGIRRGDELKIPVGAKEVIEEDETDAVPIDSLIAKMDDEKGGADTAAVWKEVKEDSIVMHPIQPGETLYSLSKRFMISQEVLKEENAGLPEGLKAGDTLRIPLEKIVKRKVYVKSPGADTLGRSFVDSAVFKDEYEVVLLVPLLLDENRKKEAKRKATKDRELHPTTLITVDFYRGVRLAVDSLSKAGLSVNLHVIDTEKNPEMVRKKLEEDHQDADMIIGPFYSSVVKTTSEFAKENQIHMVVPVPQSNKLLFNNPFVSKAMPSPATRVKGLARYIAKHHHKDNIVLVNSKKEKDKYLYKVFRQTLMEELEQYPDALRKEPAETHVEQYSRNSLKNKVDKELHNVFVSPSREIAFVSNFMTKMVAITNDWQYYKSEITVFGLEEWDSYSSIDLGYKQKVNLHIASGTYMDYDSTATIGFVKHFRKEFGTDPYQYGFLGFDVAYNYLSALNYFGTALPAEIGKLDQEGLHAKFRLEQVEPGSGFENNSCFILKYEDYDLKRMDACQQPAK